MGGLAVVQGHRLSSKSKTRHSGLAGGRQAQHTNWQKRANHGANQTSTHPKIAVSARTSLRTAFLRTSLQTLNSVDTTLDTLPLDSNSANIVRALF